MAGSSTKAKGKSEPKRRPGRPSILTEALADQILQAASAGNYIEVAAQAAGINKQTLYNWRAKAAEFDDATDEQLAALDDETALLVWFVDALKRSEAQAEVDALASVRAASTHWQAHAWFLERRHQARYRMHLAAEHSGEVRAKLEPEQVRAELAAFDMPAATAVAAGPDAVTPPEDA